MVNLVLYGGGPVRAGVAAGCLVTARTEAEIIRRLEFDSEGGGRLQFMRMMGVQGTSVSIMMTFWNHPLIMLLISIWTIGRGSAAVAAEIERGTMDLILSRPVAHRLIWRLRFCSRTIGLAILAAALFAGASVTLRPNPLREPPTPSVLDLARRQPGRPGFADLRLHPYWRRRWTTPAGDPPPIGSILTLGGMIAYVVSMIPVLQQIRAGSPGWSGPRSSSCIIRSSWWPQEIRLGSISRSSRRSASASSFWPSSRSPSAICRPVAEEPPA